MLKKFIYSWSNSPSKEQGSRAFKACPVCRMSLEKLARSLSNDPGTLTFRKFCSKGRKESPDLHSPLSLGRSVEMAARSTAPSIRSSNASIKSPHELVECPVCFHECTVPIRQCLEGHLICNAWSLALASLTRPWICFFHFDIC